MTTNRALIPALLCSLLVVGCVEKGSEAIPAPRQEEEVPPWEVWREGAPTPDRDATPERRTMPDVEPSTAAPEVRERTFVPVGRDDPWRGAALAKVTIVEFDDFECVYCKKVTPTLRRLLEVHGDEVRVVFKHYPLTKLHSRAEPTHRAAEALRAQGNDAFWAFYYLAHDHHKDLSDINIERWVVLAGGDRERWRRDLQDPRTDAKIAADKALGKEAGVTGTPNFFINGTRLTGAQGYDAFEAAFMVELDRANQALARGVTMADLYEELSTE